MIFIPAIDLLGGAVVRLAKGEFSQSTQFRQDPLAVAQEFQDAGATHLHIVDLDGTQGAERPGANVAIVEAIVEAHAESLKVQVGGGIRDEASAERWIALGVARIVLGTIAVTKPRLSQAICARFPGKVIVAVDAQRGFVKTHGWQSQSEMRATELAARAEDWGAAALLFTDIERDGMEGGPALEATAALQAERAIPVIASGGIGTLDHLRALRAAEIRECVCGKALYAGNFGVEAAIAASRGIA